MLISDIQNKYCFVKAFIEKYCQIIDKDYLIDYLEQDHGTGGWQSAFEYACKYSDNHSLVEYCERLQWDEYDKFSSNINEIILEAMKNQHYFKYGCYTKDGYLYAYKSEEEAKSGSPFIKLIKEIE